MYTLRDIFKLDDEEFETLEKMTDCKAIQKVFSGILDKVKEKPDETSNAFSLYESLFLVMCRNCGCSFAEISRIFDENEYCRPRTKDGLKNRYALIKKKYRHLLNDCEKLLEAFKKDEFVNMKEELSEEEVACLCADNEKEFEKDKDYAKNFIADSYSEKNIRNTSMNPYLAMVGISTDENNMLNDVLNSEENKHSEKIMNSSGTSCFSYYENVLLLVLKRHAVSYAAIIKIFEADIHCRKRSLESLKSRYKKLNRQLGAGINGSWDDILHVIRPVDPEREEIRKMIEEDLEEEKEFYIPITSYQGKGYIMMFEENAGKILNYISEHPEDFKIGMSKKYNDYELVYLYFADKVGITPEDISQYFTDNDHVCNIRTPKNIVAKIAECDAENWVTAKESIKKAIKGLDKEDETPISESEQDASAKAPVETEEAEHVEKEAHPTSYIRNVDYGTPQSANKPKPEFPLGAIFADKMNMSDTITKAQFADKKKYFATVQSLMNILKRNNGLRMNKAVRIGELAFFWGCTIEEATDRVDTFISRGVPVTREGELVRLVLDADNTRGGIELHHIEVPEIDLGNGASVVRLGVVSDTHYGSPMCQESLIEQFYEIAYEAGVRAFVHAGDFFDGEGVYKGQDFEINAKGFDKNLLHVADIYPKFPDATTYAIVGNHDHSYISKTGANPVFHLASIRDDIKYMGIYQANLKVNDEFLVNLHHGAAGCSRVAPESYLRRIINDKQEFLQSIGAEKYDLCVLGHFHIDAEVTTPFCRKGIFGGGWQGTTAFTRRLNLPTYIGGYIVNMYKLPDGEHYITVEKVPFNLDNALCNIA